MGERISTVFSILLDIDFDMYNSFYISEVSDDDIVESMMLDVRYQYALHTTSYEEQPSSEVKFP